MSLEDELKTTVDEAARLARPNHAALARAFREVLIQRGYKGGDSVDDIRAYRDDNEED